MTNFKQVVGNCKREGNIKDGHHPSRRQTKSQRQDDEDQWLAAGFLYQWIRNAPRWTYTWKGNFPVFEVTPGHLGAGTGLVARHLKSDIEILFPYGTHPGDIAAHLNNEIEAIMFYDAEIDDRSLMPETNDWIDIDDFMRGQWVRS